MLYIIHHQYASPHVLELHRHNVVVFAYLRQQLLIVIRFIVFLKAPRSANFSLLAFFANAAHAGTEVAFRYTTYYYFMYAETGVVTPAISFKA